MDHETQTLQIGHTLVEIIAYVTAGALPRVSVVFTPTTPAFTPEQTRTLTSYLKIAANLAEAKARARRPADIGKQACPRR